MYVEFCDGITKTEKLQVHHRSDRSVEPAPEWHVEDSRHQGWGGRNYIQRNENNHIVVS
jgi:hypothetical protein